MGGYLKCIDPDNVNKYVVISEGDIGFYEDVDGVPKLATAVTQLGLYNVTNGGSVVTDERFVTKYGMPQVFVSPNSVNVFNVNGVGLDQELNIQSPAVSVDGAGRASFSVSGGLTKKTTGSGSLLVPSSGQRIWYSYDGDKNTPITNGEDYVEKFAAEWAIPAINAKSASACARVWGNAIRCSSAWQYCSSSWEYSLAVGIGNGASAFYWGTPTSGIKPNDTEPMLVSAAVNGAQSGSHIHVKVECEASTSNVSTSIPISYGQQWAIGNNPMLPLYVNCLPDDGSISAAGSGFTALVMGR